MPSGSAHIITVTRTTNRHNSWPRRSGGGGQPAILNKLFGGPSQKSGRSVDCYQRQVDQNMDMLTRLGEQIADLGSLSRGRNQLQESPLASAPETDTEVGGERAFALSMSGTPSSNLVTLIDEPADDALMAVRRSHSRSRRYGPPSCRTQGQYGGAQAQTRGQKCTLEWERDHRGRTQG